MERSERFLENLSTSLLITVGIGGVLVTLLDFIGMDFENGPWKWVKGPLPVILLTVAVLALALGIERFTRFQQLTRQIGKIESALEKSIGGQILEDYDELYNMATRLIWDASRHIRTSSLGPYHSQAPQNYRDAIMEVLLQSKKQRRPIRYDMVVGSALTLSPNILHKKIETRTRKLQDLDLLTLGQIFVADVAWGIDILVVDTRHVLLAFPNVRGISELKAGIVFVDQPKIATELANWYDEFLTKQAMTYEEFLDRFPLENNDYSSPEVSEDSNNSTL